MEDSLVQFPHFVVVPSMDDENDSSLNRNGATSNCFVSPLRDALPISRDAMPIPPRRFRTPRQSFASMDSDIDSSCDESIHSTDNSVQSTKDGNLSTIEKISPSSVEMQTKILKKLQQLKHQRQDKHPRQQKHPHRLQNHHHPRHPQYQRAQEQTDMIQEIHSMLSLLVDNGDSDGNRGSSIKSGSSRRNRGRSRRSRDKMFNSSGNSSENGSGNGGTKKKSRTRTRNSDSNINSNNNNPNAIGDVAQRSKDRLRGVALSGKALIDRDGKHQSRIPSIYDHRHRGAHRLAGVIDVNFFSGNYYDSLQTVDPNNADNQVRSLSDSFNGIPPPPLCDSRQTNPPPQQRGDDKIVRSQRALSADLFRERHSNMVIASPKIQKAMKLSSHRRTMVRTSSQKSKPPVKSVILSPTPSHLSRVSVDDLISASPVLKKAMKLSSHHRRRTVKRSTKQPKQSNKPISIASDRSSHTHDRPLSVSVLASATPEMRKTMIGERLYQEIIGERMYEEVIHQSEHDLAVRITGILLESDDCYELLNLLKSPKKVMVNKIDEVLEVLNMNGHGSVRTLPRLIED